MTIYTTGTVSVTAGSAIVTGSGTAWNLSLVQGGLFSCDGLSVPILQVDSDTQLTIAYPWPGTTGSGKVYAIDRQSAAAASAIDANDRLALIVSKLLVSPYLDQAVSGPDTLLYGSDADQVSETAFTEAARALVNLAGAASANKLPYLNSDASAELTDLTAAARILLNLVGTAAADKLPYLDSENSAALTSLTPFIRTLLDDADAGSARTTLAAQQALGFTPVQQGGGTGQNPGNKIHIGWGNDELLVQVDAVNLGRVWTNYNAGGGPGSGWVKLPNGLILQAGSSVVTANAAGDYTAYLPTTYPTVNVTVVVCNGDANASPTRHDVFSPPSVGSFAAKAVGVANAPVRVNWFSWGY